MSKALKNTIKIIAFLIIFVVLFSIFTRYFHFKYAVNLEEFYKLPKDSVDVLMIGSSHAYRHFDPNVLYDESGITSFALGSPSQLIWNSYHYLVEALKTQSPKVVFLECYRVDFQSDYSDYATAIKAVSSMKLSWNYIEALKAAVEDKENLIDYFLMFPWYHTRYTELRDYDILDNYGNDYYVNFLGYKPLFTPVAGELAENLEDITERKPLTDKNIEYLDKIVELSEERGFELVFVITPFWSKAEARQPYYNSLADYAEERGITLIQGNYMYDELEIDPEQDFSTGSHLSDAGVKKFTYYLLDYLNSNYDLQDHRGDDYYIRWDRNREYMEQHPDIHIAI